LALALTAKADALITGDKDLLALSKVFTVPILTPAAFRTRMPEKTAK
jgi:predicted nucleic acid-binding protein